MSKYKQQTGSGQSWQRCYSIQIENPLEGSPVIIFQEEMVVVVGDTTIKKPITMCTKLFDPNETFPVLNPQTGEPTGQTMNHAEVYKILHSLYIQTALQRDGQAEVTSGPEPGLKVFS